MVRGSLRWYIAFAVPAFAGCGRIAFDVAGREGPCANPDPIAATVKLTGTTFQYTDFLNNTSPFPNVSVGAFDVDGGMNAIATTLSDASSNYELMIPTNGAPRPAVIKYSQAGFWSTWVDSDQPYDRDLVAANMTHWRLGDGPIWSDGSMGSVYSTLNATIDASLGTLSISARTCSGELVTGVHFDIDPMPSIFGYLDSSGLPKPMAAGTMPPYAQLVAFGVTPGPTVIRASKAGLQFNELSVMVLPGDNISFTVVHPNE